MSKRYNGEILGELQIGSNCCTEPIKIHPLGSDTWHLVPDDIDSHKEKTDYVSLISFRKSQIWEVYYYRFADCQGWCVERQGLYLRMPEKDFERFFGKYKILPKDTFSVKSPEFSCEDMTMVDDLTEEELQEVKQHIKEIKERKRMNGKVI